MAAMSRMLPLVAFSTFAIFLLALLATPTNALSNVGGHPHHSRGHDSIAKRKRSPMKRAKRCRPQSSTLPAAATTSATTSYAAPASTEAADPQTTAEPSTTKAPESTKPATTSAAAATTSASGGGGGGTVNSSKKLLLAWPNGPTDLEKYTGSRVAGMYTWSPYKPGNADALGIPFFPMLWGTKQKSVFPGQVDPLSTPTMIFGFNEPNQGDQANMSAKDGATLWNSMIRPYADKGWKLVSPACTSAPSGKTWIQDMQAACGGSCGFDYIALHWYGTSIDEFKKYVEDFWTTFGIPLIISEYACQNFSGGAQCSKSETEAFHYTMGAWFDQHPGVAMYAPFGFMHDMYNVNYDNQLMASDGSPTAVGRWYLDH